MITPVRLLMTNLMVILTCSVWAIMDTKLCPCKQTTDKKHTLEDDKRYERWKMEKTATTIKCYHVSFTGNALPLVHLRWIKAQCDKSTSCPCQRGWCLASIQVLQNKSVCSFQNCPMFLLTCHLRFIMGLRNIMNPNIFIFKHTVCWHLFIIQNTPAELLPVEKYVFSLLQLTSYVFDRKSLSSYFCVLCKERFQDIEY